jgi:SulP family sulfate permease
MALAISSGVAPQYGLYTAIVAGSLVALFGGARVQITGPTAAFVVILAPISARYGLGGLLLASLMAGAILVVLGFARLGRLIEFIPHPVTTGFTAGIATVIALLQLKDFFGLSLAGNPEHFLERVVATARALPSFQPGDLIVGVFTLLLLVAWPRVTARVPPALIALPAAAVLAIFLARYPSRPAEAPAPLAGFGRGRRATRPHFRAPQDTRPQRFCHCAARGHRVFALRGGGRRYEWDSP